MALHRSAEIWGEDAREFRPERWQQPPEGSSAIPGVWGRLLTFIGGPRSCIGYRFAVVECVHFAAPSCFRGHRTDTSLPPCAQAQGDSVHARARVRVRARGARGRHRRQDYAYGISVPEERAREGTSASAYHQAVQGCLICVMAGDSCAGRRYGVGQCVWCRYREFGFLMTRTG